MLLVLLILSINVEQALNTSIKNQSGPKLDTLEHI